MRLTLLSYGLNSTQVQILTCWRVHLATWTLMRWHLFSKLSFANVRHSLFGNGDDPLIAREQFLSLSSRMLSIPTLRRPCLPRRTSESRLKGRPCLLEVLVEMDRCHHQGSTMAIPCGSRLPCRPWRCLTFLECDLHHSSCSILLLPLLRAFRRRTETFFARSLT